MICNRWLGLRGGAASVAFVLLFAGGLVAPKSQAQSAQTSVAGSVIKPTAPPAFLVAPSVSLGYSPTSVAAGHLAAGDRLDLVTADYNAGSITVFRAVGPGSFATGIPYPAGHHPSALTIADIDGDGRPDLILANESEGVISVFRGNGDGTLSPRHTFPVGFAPSFLVVGDFTGSGKQDVVAAGASRRNLAFLQNDGTGSLKRALNYSLPATPTALLSADLNHDGHLDIAVATAAGTISILLGTGNGQFTVLPEIHVSTGALSSIAVGDFNRDGIIDLGVTAAEDGKLAVLTGKGDGTFASPVFYAVGNSPVSTHVADVDGNGIADLIVVNEGSNTFSVLNGVGDGTFRSALQFVVGNSPLGAAIGDLYGSGRVDIATIDALSRTLTVPVGNGDGTFGASRAYDAGVQPVSVASGDLDEDGTPDLVAANYCAADASCGGNGNAAVLLAGPGGTYRLSSTYVMGTGSVSIALRDVNGDKKLDLVALNRVDKTLSVRLGAGDGTFGSLATIPLSASPIAVESGDFNKDGNLDLAVLGDCGSAKCSQPGELAILLGSGDGSFRSAATYSAGYSPVSLAVGATRPGGTPDIVVASRCGRDAACLSGGTATVFQGNGKGGFTEGTDLVLGNGPTSIALANLRDLGTLDLVVSCGADNAVAVFAGAGDGSFKGAVSYAVGTTPGALTIADFNGDGIPDVAVANTADSTVSVLFGRNDGTLQKAFALPVGGNPAGLTAIPGPMPGHASLATANGSVASTAAVSNVTVVSNVQITPLVGTTPSSTQLTVNPPTTTVNPSTPVTVSVTVTHGSSTPTGTVTISSDGTPATVCTISLVAGAGSCNTSALQTNVSQINAQYNGDGTYAAGNTVSKPITVNALTPVIDLTTVPPSPGSPQSVNTSVTFTATLSGVKFTPVAPTSGATVEFLADGNPIPNCGTQPLTAAGADYQATCTTSSLHSASHSITAHFRGDSGYDAATSSAITYQVNARTGTLSTSSSVGSSTTVGTAVTFTVTYAVSPVSPIAPTGTVTFTINGVPNTTCPNKVIGSNLEAACTTTALTAGNYVIAASFGGDSDFTPPAAPAINLAVTQATPVVHLTADNSTASVNQSVTFTATVSSPGASPQVVLPTGNVTFMQGSTPLCSSAGLGTVNPPTATCKYAFSSAYPSPGTAITATYSPDQNFFAGNPATANEIVNPTHVTVKLTSSGTGLVNQPVTYSTTLTPDFTGAAIPQGTVTLTTTGPTQPTDTCAQPLPITNGTVPSCAFTYGASTGGNDYNVTATFNPTGTPVNFQSNSATIPQAVNAGSIGIIVNSAPNPSEVNQLVTFTAAFPTVGVVPTAGTVTYADGTSTICTVQIQSTGGIPNCTYAFLTAGPHNVQASFPGDVNFKPGSSNVVPQVVNRTPVATSVTPSANPSTVNQVVTFTATLALPQPPQFTGTALPTGTVTFSQTQNGQTTFLCATPSPLPQNGGTSATCTVPFGSIGSYSITAVYNGDSNFVQGTSTALPQTVGQPSLAVSVTPDLTASTVNQAVHYTVVLTPSTTGTTTPTGKVTFSDPGSPNTLLCQPVTLVGNSQTGTSSATCQVTFVNAGNHAIMASYNGDLNFPAKSGPAPAVSVRASTTKTSLSSSAVTSFANQMVTYVATIAPTANQGLNLLIPAGAVTFGSTDPTGLVHAGCPSPIALTPNGDGSASASCMVTFPHITTPPGQFTVTAAYSDTADGNFLSSSSTVPQTVQDFNATLSVLKSNTHSVSSAAGVYLTQNSSTSTDIFGAATLSALIATSTGYNPSMTVECEVYITNPAAPVTDPGCTPSTPQTFGIQQNAGAQAFAVQASANAAVDKYTIRFTAYDPAYRANAQIVEFPLFLVTQSPSLTLAAGSLGTLGVLFNTAQAPSTLTIKSYSCPNIWDVNNQVAIDNTARSHATCTGATTTPITVSGLTTSMSITINIGAPVASNQQPSATYLASLLGVPIFAVIGWFATARSARRNLFRFLGLVPLLIGLSYATGCGGSFHSTSVLSTATGLQPGSYVVQVVATDQSGNNYFGQVPLSVVKNQ